MGIFWRMQASYRVVSRTLDRNPAQKIEILAFFWTLVYGRICNHVKSKSKVSRTSCHHQHNGFLNFQRAETLAKCSEYIWDHLVCFWAPAGLLQKKVREIQRDFPLDLNWFCAHRVYFHLYFSYFFWSSPAGAQKHTKWSQMYSEHLAKVSARWKFRNPLCWWWQEVNP